MRPCHIDRVLRIALAAAMLCSAPVHATVQVNHLATNPHHSSIAFPMPALNQQLYRPATVVHILARNAEGIITKSLSTFAIRMLPPYPSHWSTTEQLKNQAGEGIPGAMFNPLVQSRTTGNIYGVGLTTTNVRENPDDETSAASWYWRTRPIILRLENDGALGTQLNAEPEIIHRYDSGDGIRTLPDNERRDGTPLLIDDRDGRDDLYYITPGPTRQGRLVRLRQAAQAGWETGVPEPVIDFPASPIALPPDLEYSLSKRLPPAINSMLLGSNGKIYGTIGYLRGVAGAPTTPNAPDTTTGLLWQLDPETDQFEILHRYTLAEGELYQNSGHLVEKDGYLYGSLGSNCLAYINRYRSAWPESGVLHDGFGSTFSPICAGEQGVGAADRPLYLIPYPHADNPDPFGALFRIKLDGSDFQILHRFSDGDGSHPSGPLAVGGDGHIYGTTLAGGQHRSLNIQWTADDITLGNAPLGNAFHRGYMNLNASTDGTLFRLKTADIVPGVLGSGFEHLHAFQGGVGDNRQGNDGTAPVGLRAGADGKLYGMTSQGGRRLPDAESDDPYLNTIYGAVFQVDPDSTAPSARIALTAEPATLKLGESSLLQWTANHASDCVASGGETGDGWAGAKASNGSHTATPSTAGQITYNLTCRNDLLEPVNGTRPALSNSVRLYVEVSAKEHDGNVMDYDSKGGGSLPGLALMLMGALAAGRRYPRHRR